MKRQIEERTCDQCGKSVRMNPAVYGGNPFAGWIQVSMENGSIFLPACRLWDFCCKHCAIKYIDIEME